MAGNRIDIVRDIGRAIPDPATTDPRPIGVDAEIGTSPEFARSDHVHQFQYAYVKDIKPSGTNGGTPVAGWNTRELNTIETNIPDFTLSSNRINFPSGVYKVTASAPANSVGRHKILLYNVTDSETVIVGSNAYSNISYGAHNLSILQGILNISNPKSFEIHHYITSPAGIGYATNAGVDEVYTQVEIFKIG